MINQQEVGEMAIVLIRTFNLLYPGDPTTGQMRLDELKAALEVATNATDYVIGVRKAEAEAAAKAARPTLKIVK